MFGTKLLLSSQTKDQNW